MQEFAKNSGLMSTKQPNQTAKVKPGIGMLETEDGTTTKNGSEITTILNDYFCTVFARENLEHLPPDHILPFFDSFTITPKQVNFQLSRK